jgi:threonine dehydratase
MSDRAVHVISADDIARAAHRIAGHAIVTPVEESPVLGEETGASVWLKCEQLQWSGSFKLRGALNAVLSLTPEQRERGIITASTGNHGRAVATALKAVNAHGTVYLPTTAAEVKVRALRRFPQVELVFFGENGGTSELEAGAVAAREGRHYISPYNDPVVVAGQGTLGREMAEQCPPIDVAFISVGGGGLISGVAAALKAARASTRIVGCWPENSTAMYESMRAGRVVDVAERPTLSDGTAGSVEPGAITLDYCRALIDECVLVSEDEIASAMRLLAAEHRMIVEGSAGVAVAAFRKTAQRWRGATVAIVLCGGNIGFDTLTGVLCSA